jgi:Rps23 Pro-64 3,4-dihydroxylase Tpa1-like proline 4-hydroxylase
MDMLETAEELIDWFKDALDKHKTKIIDFEQRWVWKICDEFKDESGLTRQEMEESYIIIENKNTKSGVWNMKT